ncbi:MAG: hypothetical protein QM791_09070 [Ferruginibacter sp.]
MKYTFRELKTSWGIVVTIDVQESTVGKKAGDIQLLENVYCRINTSSLEQPVITYWFSLAINDFYNRYPVFTKKEVVCYEINSLEFSHTDFQEEGLYYAMHGWLSQNYETVTENTDAYYDKEKNRYIFPKLKDHL